MSFETRKPRIYEKMPVQALPILAAALFFKGRRIDPAMERFGEIRRSFQYRRVLSHPDYSSTKRFDAELKLWREGGIPSRIRDREIVPKNEIVWTRHNPEV